MALEGSLDTFGLTDVMSLLAMTGKTGDLRLRREDSVTGYVRLREGVVVAASSDDARQALARQLVVSGLVPDEAFDAASGASGESLAAALVSAAGLSSSVVGALSQAQVLNAVFELLRWPNGSFTFDVVEHEPSAVDASLTVEQAIAEAQTRLAAWPTLTARVPAAQTILAVSLTPAGPAGLEADEWGVLGLFDGHRSIGEAVALSTSGEWETVSLLAGLVERGLLVPADDRSSAAHRASLLSRIGLSVAPPSVPFSVPAQPVAPEVLVAPDVVAEPELGEDDFDSLTTLASAASALEAASPSEAAGDGVDEALLQRLIAGVSAI